MWWVRLPTPERPLPVLGWGKLAATLERRRDMVHVADSRLLLALLLPVTAALFHASHVHASSPSEPTVAESSPPLHTIHVCAARGDDANDGSLHAPLRTLVAARDSVRRLRRADTELQPAEIVLHAVATHNLKEPLVLDRRDSHTRYKTLGGEAVLVSGGVKVEPAAVSRREGYPGQYQVTPPPFAPPI